jgi:hypothetical protein
MDRTDDEAYCERILARVTQLEQLLRQKIDLDVYMAMHGLNTHSADETVCSDDTVCLEPSSAYV